ncbi:MAG: hypothetical protein ACO1SX_05085, partial [Actinomycetota bacterium]
TLRARAEKGAAQKKWSVAIHQINEAQKRVRTARREALYQGGKKPSSEAYRRERAALRAWMVSQEKLARDGKKDRKLIARELKVRQTELNRKHGVQSSTQPNSAAVARLDLLAASLEDNLADYYFRKGNANEAAAHRRAALVTRLQVHQAQGKAELAKQAADKLLTATPNDPESYVAAGSYYQEKGQLKRAAQIWQQGISAVESGLAPVRPTGAARDRTRTKNQYLGHFYRQQAYCYSKLGRANDAKAAMRKAATFDAAPRG